MATADRSSILVAGAEAEAEMGMVSGVGDAEGEAAGVCEEEGEAEKVGVVSSCAGVLVGVSVFAGVVSVFVFAAFVFAPVFELAGAAEDVGSGSSIDNVSDTE